MSFACNDRAIDSEQFRPRLMSENQEPVQFQVTDRMARVTLNRPDRHNAFNSNVIDQLDEILSELEGREDVIALVLRGRGESFSAGADLNWMEEAAGASEKENREDALELARMLNDLYTLPLTTIACVKGAALGGGLGLVACCDIVITRTDATFGLSEVRVGLIPATISPYVLAAIGPRQTRRYAQTGERFTGTKAAELGLAHEVVEDDDEMENVLDELLRSLRKNGPRAMAKAKQLCLDFAGRRISEDVIEETARRIAAARTSEEGREGVRAFLSDRPPSWINEEQED